MNALRKLVRFLALTLFAAAVVVALAIGGFQLLVRRLPSYQDDVQAWVTAELGLELDYAQLDAALSWRGPELAFSDVKVRAVGDAAPFLTARGANVGFNAFDLLADFVARRTIGVDRLTFDGTELTLVRTETGAYRLQGAPAAPGRDELRVEVPPDIDVLVRNSRVLYLDPARSLAWDFQNVAGSLRRDADLLTLEASARPPREFAERIEVSVQAVVTAGETVGARFTGDWRLSADVNDVDLAVAQRLFPAAAVVPQAGRGDVAVQLEWQKGALAGGTAQLALADVELQSSLGVVDSRYERIAFAGDWQRTNDSWRFGLRDVAVTRGGRAWPTEASVDIEFTRVAESLESFALRSSFLRLEDLTPFFAPLPESRLIESWFALQPRGDLRALDVALERKADGGIDYTVAGEFAGLGIEPFEDAPGVTGLTGQVRADSRTGRLELASADVGLDWQTLFRDALDVPELRGILVWRTGQDAVRLVSDDLVVVTPAATLRSNLELTLPMDGSSPKLDLRTDVSEFDIAAAPRYFPVHKMPPGVVRWLDSALRGGRAIDTEVVFVGPVQAFPFDGGEGEFRATLEVEDTELAFVRDWPSAQDLDGTVEFVNARFEARGSGRLLGNRTENLSVRIGDLRAADFTLQANTTGGLDQVLAFLNGAPMIRGHLGQDFARLEAWAGTGDIALDLALPLRNRADYRLTAGLTIAGGDLAYRGFPAHMTEVQGSLMLADGVLRGQGVQGIFMDGPVTATVDAAEEPGYRARIDLDGEVTIDAVVDAFNLPYGELMAGQTAWRGTFLIPSGSGTENYPARVTIDSNLSGVALRFPEPFAKPPGVPTNLELAIAFPPSGLSMTGNLGATRRFALEFDATPGLERPFRFKRAAVGFGGELAEFRADSGVTLNGSLPVLHADDWIALLKQSSGGASGNGGWSGTFAGGDLDVAEFSVLGQQLGSSRFSARRLTDDWQLDIESDAIAGTLLVPVDLAADPQVVAVMRRLYLNPGDGSGTASGVDPRDLPGLQLHADAFGVDQRARRGDSLGSVGPAPRVVRERDRRVHGAGQRRLVHGRRRRHDALRGQHQFDERGPDAESARFRAVRRGRDGRDHGQPVLARTAVGLVAGSHGRRPRVAGRDRQPRRCAARRRRACGGAPVDQCAAAASRARFS
jgi:uncharacterized protein (TIGR02099 family)